MLQGRKPVFEPIRGFNEYSSFSNTTENVGEQHSGLKPFNQIIEELHQ